MAQGIAFDKDKVLNVLKDLFKLGYNRRKACIAAGFDPTTLAKWEKKDPSLSIKIDAWISEPNRMARRNWVEEIKQGNFNASKDWLDRIERDDFSQRQELDHTTKGKPIDKLLVELHKKPDVYDEDFESTDDE